MAQLLFNMAGGLYAKPYEMILQRYPRFAKEIRILPEEFLFIVEDFLPHIWTEDDFNEMVVSYYSFKTSCPGSQLAKMVREDIETKRKERTREFFKLYNPYRNISLNQCFGDSKTPVSEWMNLSDWQEW